MGAATTVYVKIRRSTYEWIEVSAVTLQEAKLHALSECVEDDVEVVDAQFEEPEDL